MDTWINGYSSPLLDNSQDIYNASGRINDGVTTLTFSRKRTSSDTKVGTYLYLFAPEDSKNLSNLDIFSQDFSFTDDKCLYLIYPVKGGEFHAVNKKIRKHESIPVVSSQRVCIRNCPAGMNSELLLPDE